MNEEHFRCIEVAGALARPSYSVSPAGERKRTVQVFGTDTATGEPVSGVARGAAAQALVEMSRPTTIRVCPKPEDRPGSEPVFRYVIRTEGQSPLFTQLVVAATEKIGLPGVKWLTELAHINRGFTLTDIVETDMAAFVERMTHLDIGMRGIPSMLLEAIYEAWPSHAATMLYDEHSDLFRAARPAMVRSRVREAYAMGSTAAFINAETSTLVRGVRAQVLPFPMRRDDAQRIEACGLTVVATEEDGSLDDIFVQEASVTDVEAAFCTLAAGPLYLPEENAARSTLRTRVDNVTLLLLNDRTTEAVPSAARLDHVQTRSLIKAMTYPVSVVTGGPGTGKTTTMAAVAELLSSCWPLRLLAPTGKAARRLSQATGLPASTIHRWALVEEESRPLAVVVDEASMLDIDMLDMLMQANIARLVLVGDVDQLPSVGPGNVLKDTIEILHSMGREDAVLRLEHNYRSGTQPALIRAVLSVRDGEYKPQILSVVSHDFQRVSITPSESSSDATERMKRMWIEDVRTLGHERVQALIPVYKGGINAFNTWAQATLNPHSPVIFPGGAGKFVRDGDRVVITENISEYELYNGAIGVLTRGSDSELVRFIGDDGQDVSIPREDLYVDGAPAVTCGYAISVHRSQGSEWDRIHALVLDQFGRGLYRESLYTALTRARERAVLHATDSALARVFNNRGNDDRLTLLATHVPDPAGARRE
jgi:hypothetical protein